MSSARCRTTRLWRVDRREGDFRRFPSAPIGLIYFVQLAGSSAREFAQGFRLRNFTTSNLNLSKVFISSCMALPAFFLDCRIEAALFLSESNILGSVS